MKLTFALAGLILSMAAAADWPQFRGPDGNGIAPEAGPTEWTVEEGVVWKTTVPGEGWSSPVIADGKVVLTSAVEENGKQVLKAMAFDRADGRKLWETELLKPSEAEVRAIHSKNNLASSTPVIADGRVYAHFGHMGTAAVALADGKLLWTQKIPYPPTHGAGSSPVRVADLLVFSADGSEDPRLIALDANTGEVHWSVPRGHEVRQKFSFASPTVVNNGGRTEIISPASGMVGAYSPADGELLWKVAYGDGYSVVPKPVEMDGRLLICTGFGKPNLLSIRMEGANGDVTGSHVEWSAERNIPKVPSVIAHDGLVLTVDDTGRVSCFDADNGETKWTDHLPGNFSASPVLAGGSILYAPSEDGIFFVMKVGADAGELIFEIDMGERLFASPAVVDGALFVRSEKSLWKIKP